MLLVHNEIHYVPIGDGWEEVLVRNILHYVRTSTSLCTNNTRPHFHLVMERAQV